LKTDSLIEEIVRVDIPTKYGHLNLLHSGKNTSNEHLALIKENGKKMNLYCQGIRPAPGDILDPLRCDCGDQLQSHADGGQ
jgi:3,4-dihydroxy 2-butanone 4-phosphate synthase/GTP cyclohydrolase II